MTRLSASLLDRWLWLCPALAIVLAAGVLVIFGVTVWTALLGALLLVCPALIVWGMVRVGRDEREARKTRRR